ncbi:MAG: DUF1801 domain-containing protein [Rubrivivax sp.]
MAENKTKPTDAGVDDYIASRASAQQSADCGPLMALLKAVTKQDPKMWGAGIVGYGSYQYKYESGRTGTAPLVGFALRGREMVLYLAPDWNDGDEARPLLEKLGAHKMGKGCLYFKRFADLDEKVLEQLIARSVAELKRRHANVGGA